MIDPEGGAAAFEAKALEETPAKPRRRRKADAAAADKAAVTEPVATPPVVEASLAEDATPVVKRTRKSKRPSTSRKTSAKTVPANAPTVAPDAGTSSAVREASAAIDPAKTTDGGAATDGAAKGDSSATTTAPTETAATKPKPARRKRVSRSPTSAGTRRGTSRTRPAVEDTAAAPAVKTEPAASPVADSAPAPASPAATSRDEQTTAEGSASVDASSPATDPTTADDGSAAATSTATDQNATAPPARERPRRKRRPRKPRKPETPPVETPAAETTAVGAPEVEIDAGPDEEPKLAIDADSLNDTPLSELISVAQGLRIPNAANLTRRGLAFRILAAQTNRIRTSGVLQVMRDGYGFLRGAATSYLPGPDDVYVPPPVVREHDLRTGDTVEGLIRPPRRGERYFAVVDVESLNHGAPSERRDASFYELTPLHPKERFMLEHENGEISTRIMDMLCPLGKGQRALIVSPPRAGKTVLMQSIAHAITANHPEVVLLVLLIDERPEEVTEMSRSVRGEVIASTFDEPAKQHVQVADLVIKKARRLAEQGRDVVILLDSITRLARAHNTVCPSSGRILSGGVDANALQEPKRFFGSARCLDEGGSLTIIATALIETGSRMDEVIFEEFKGTGNSEIVLERKLADRRIWPSMDLNKSGTRKEELLIDHNDLHRIWLLRKVVHPLEPAEAMQLLIERVGKTDTNAQFLDSMKLVEE